MRKHPGPARAPRVISGSLTPLTVTLVQPPPDSGAGPMLTRDAVRRVVASRRTESVGDVPYHRDGDERKTTVVLTPLVSPQGELIGVLALAGGDDTGGGAGAKTR